VVNVVYSGESEKDRWTKYNVGKVIAVLNADLLPTVEVIV
jgi:hypothetical protein